jgi:two-component system CheB/CheR fusion protein
LIGLFLAKGKVHSRKRVISETPYKVTNRLSAMDNKHTILQFPPPALGFIPSTLPFFVVGIGASAGGVDALTRFFQVLPSDTGMAFVVVMHLSPEHESNIDQILQAKTKMKVLQVNDTTPIESNHVYIIPPSKDLVMNDGSLQVISAARPRGHQVAIDMFLRTLAEVHRERAVGIILSGAGSDGTVGISRIKEKGGITMVQSPDDAQYDSMPRHAIETGIVDLVLPVAEMPDRLVELFNNANALQLPDAAEPSKGTGDDHPGPDATEKALREIMEILHVRTGHDFTHYKRATVLRRLERRLQVNGLPNIIAYRKYLEQYSQETRALLADMLISVTNFFRDREAFDVLEREIIPAVFKNAPEEEAIRAWSVGCATGEETYSLAMLLTDQNALMPRPRTIQVFGSDIDERAIQIARHGHYPESIVADVTPARLHLYFDRDDDHYCIKRELREHILFAAHNVLRDPPFSKLNLITCRNLLIYLNRDIQRKVFEIFHYALHPNGYLFLGTAESAEGISGLFKPIDKKYRIYQAVPVRQSRIPLAIPKRPSAPIEELLPIAAEGKPGHLDVRKEPLKDIHYHLLDAYAPPNIVIDQNNDAVYVSKQAGRYLHYPTGETSRNILTIISPELQLELRTALFQAKQSDQSVSTHYIPLSRDQKTIAVRMVICPAQDQHAATGMILLAFEEKGESDSGQAVAVKINGEAVSLHLEQELAETRQQLRTTIGQYETSLEDLKASNEELQSINEELRSTTEEMETSKEELQSTNEELITVNHELKRKVDETARANDDLHNFFSATEIAVIFIDRSLRIKRYTRPATNIFNLIAADLDRSLLDITHRLAYPQMQQDIAQVFEKLQPIEREVRSNDNYWYIAKLLPYRTAEDRIEGVVLSFVNISRRKVVEERLRVSERRMRLIAASTKDYAITTMDMAGVITSWNQGAERLFGYKEEEILGKFGDVLFTPEDKAKSAFEDELAWARHEGRVEEDRWHVRKDGTRVFCSGILAPLADEKMGGYVKIARDMTNNKWLRDQQDAKLAWEKQERIRAEEAARVRDEFFAVLSHELKQPLNLIQLTAEMLSRVPEIATQPMVARGTTTIKRMVESQTRVIDDLMDLSRLHTGKLTLNCVQVNLNDVVAHIVSLATADSNQHGITMDLEQAPEELIIYGDLVRIEQIVWNLLSNALKFTPTGGKVHVRLGRDADNACIEVADTGKGIPAEFLPFVFDMFRQANMGTTRQYGGMGVGLALVKELVSSHGGRVEAHSSGEGQGAQFRVLLPLVVLKQPSLPPPTKGENRLAGKRILLVDDTADTLDSLGALLSMENAQVTTALSGAEALNAVAAAESFDLIISDIGMPEMDGYTLLAELRKLKATARAPAIALSGFTRPADVSHALAAGFDTHICKPVAFDQFIATASRLSA